jgi:hypothetical protein
MGWSGDTHRKSSLPAIVLKYRCGTLSKSDQSCYERSGTIFKGAHEMEKQNFIFRRFAHRRNADASFDSICLACFLTVGSGLVDAELQDLESDHHCGAMGAGQLSQRTRPGASQSICQ